MASSVEPIVETAPSPRSAAAVLVGSRHITTTSMKESSVGPDVTVKEKKTAKDGPHQATTTTEDSANNNPAKETKTSPESQKDSETSDRLTPTPQAPVTGAQSSTGGYPAHAHLTPQQTQQQQQQGSYYHLGYLPSHPTPEPPSPAGPGVNVTTIGYDVGSFFQQPTAAAGSFTTSTGAAFVGPNTPLSPPRGTTVTATTMIPPASPLFPRMSSTGSSASGLSNGGLEPSVTGQQQRQHFSGIGGAPPSPNLAPYCMSPPFGPSSMYPTQVYGGATGVPTASSHSSGSPENGNEWNDRNAPAQSQQSNYQQSSPQIQGMAMSYGMAVTRGAVGGRAYSFEETMLPPSALDQQQQDQQTGNPAYSPYGGSQSSPLPSGGTLFAHHQQPWAYASLPDMYSSPGSPLQPRPTAHPQMGMYPGGAAGAGSMRGPMASYGGGAAANHQYYANCSPGPPIQTTASNKGPEGANLFIFHIPNHFTNLDMYQLFCPYGNLLSVRIMVERDTGRSRGFGFVSYDNPDSAALAIKELNGFAIGNKRLKVQHKQIRERGFHHERQSSQESFGVSSSGDSFPRSSSQFSSSSLPPSGAVASQNMWYDQHHHRKESGTAAVQGSASSEVVVGAPSSETVPDEGTEMTSTTSTTAETTPLPPMGGGSNNESPLANLGTLQNALPDVPGNGSTP